MTAQIRVHDLDLALTREPGGPFDPIDLVLLEQELDAASQAFDDLVFPALDLIHVDCDRGGAEAETPLLPVLRHLERMRVLQKRFRRDATPVQACAAQHGGAFDARGLESELRRPDRGHVAARSGADDNQVVFVFVGHKVEV